MSAPPPDPRPLLSVQICTHNNARRLGQTLGALARCHPPPVPWEVVIVPNACTDSTDAVIARWTGRLPIVVVPEALPGLARARNRGVAACRGDLIVFADDDILPEPAWLCSYWDAYRQHGATRFFGGPVISRFERTRLHPELEPVAPGSVRGIDYGAEPTILHPDQALAGANWACDRQVVNASGAFDPHLGLIGGTTRPGVGEETTLMRRLRAHGLQAQYLPQARVEHLVPPAKATYRHIRQRHFALIRFAARPWRFVAARDLLAWFADFWQTLLALVWQLCKAWSRGSRGYAEMIRLAGHGYALIADLSAISRQGSPPGE